MTTDMPIITLSNGLKVGNFSSPHAFEFVTGEVLPRCSPERVNRSELVVKEEVLPPELFNNVPFRDISITFSLTPECIQMLNEAAELYFLGDVNVVLVPLPVMQLLKMEFSNFVNHRHSMPFRVIRVADRETKKICSDRFCL